VRAIRDRLKASERALNKKAATGLFLGSLATTCGLLIGADTAVALEAGVTTAIAFTAAAASKHLDEKRDLELEDAYFLWKALDHRSHNHTDQ
jgi:hypothetical protein